MDMSYCVLWNWDRTVSIATDYRLYHREVVVRVPVASRICSLYVIHTAPRALQVSYPIGNGAASPGVKKPKLEDDHSHPRDVQVTTTRKMWRLSIEAPG
jgi:hypothetical protein